MAPRDRQRPVGDRLHLQRPEAAITDVRRVEHGWPRGPRRSRRHDGGERETVVGGVAEETQPVRKAGRGEDGVAASG